MASQFGRDAGLVPPGVMNSRVEVGWDEDCSIIVPAALDRGVPLAHSCGAVSYVMVNVVVVRDSWNVTCLVAA